MNRHSNRKQSTAWAALVTAVALCVALAPAAAAQEVAQARPGSSGIDFLPVVEHGGFVLTVSGPDGFHHRAEFGPGESPSFSIFDQGGGVLADGVYNYELTLVPSDTQRRDAFEANRLETRSGGVEPMVQTGAFSVVGGAVVAGGETEPGQRPAGSGPVLAPKTTILTTADGTIINSLCVGTDCTSSESFGFDTLRLKENNTRIRFFDTSVGSFPSVDWEIQANDSTNGGQSWLRINDLDNARSPFTIEANTPSHTLYVDSAKRVGIGTSTPVVQLHVKDGNTPTLRLEQDTSSGFAAQTWDVAGNETNFFVRSASTGSQLPFRIRPGAPTSSIDIAANGNVGIGTTSPDAALEVERSNGEAKLQVKETNTSDVVREMLVLDASAATSSRPRFTFTNGQGTWFFEVNGTNFDINRSGTGSPEELRLEEDGDLIIAGDYFSATCTSPGNPCAPDYVFEPDYELMPLEALKTFVEQNRHLPNVPSESELRKAGQINLSKFQLTLLEKIEELTLYTLSLHETVEELKADRDAKADALAALEEKLASIESVNEGE